MVAITGNVPGVLIGKDAFQEIDINGITLPMTKHNYLVRNADDLPRVFAEAFHIARTGRPGPVHIDITKDALQQETSAQHPTDEEVVAGLPGFRPNLDGERPPAQARRAGDREGQAAGHPRRPRRPPRRGLGRPRRLRREDPDPGRPHAPRHRRDRRGPSAQLRLHGHARLEARQPGDPVGRPADRDRDALRRPRHRQRPDLRAVRPDRPRRHRPGRDRQERRRRGADRRRCRARPAGAPADGRRGRAGDAGRLLRRARRVAARVRGQLVARLRGLARRPPVGRLRRQPDRRADRPPGDLRRRRRPEPDVARPLRGLPPAEQPRQLGRPRDDGLQRAGGDGRGARPARPRDLGDHRRRRLPDDVPGADDPRPGQDPGEDRAASTTRSSG